MTAKPGIDESQFIKKDGRPGGQTLIGGTEAGDDLELQTTSDGVKGDYILPEFTSAGLVANDASGVLSGGNLATAVSRSAQVGDDIDISGDEIKFRTLVGNTVFTISNPAIGRLILLELDGVFTVTLPASVVVINGDYVPALGTNFLWLFCNDAATPVYLASWSVDV